MAMAFMREGRTIDGCLFTSACFQGPCSWHEQVRTGIG